MMEFKCPKCKKIFRPHRFIALRHPNKAKCPECKVKGKITDKGQEIRGIIFRDCRIANAAAAGEPTLKEQMEVLKGGE